MCSITQIENKTGYSAYISDPNITLTFDLKVQFIGIYHLLCFRASPFLSLDMGTLMYHHVLICRIYSWPLYDCDLWRQYQNDIFIVNLCLDNIIFDLREGIPKLAHTCNTIRQLVVDIHGFCMSLTFELYVRSVGILRAFYSQLLFRCIKMR